MAAGKGELLVVCLRKSWKLLNYIPGLGNELERTVAAAALVVALEQKAAQASWVEALGSEKIPDESCLTNHTETEAAVAASARGATSK